MAQVILALLLCPHLSFRDDESDIILGPRDRRLLQAIAHLLGVDAEALEEAITRSHLTARGELIKRPNCAAECRGVIGALARGSYSRIFDYVVCVVNKLLSYSMKVSLYCTSYKWTVRNTHDFVSHFFAQVYGENMSIGILDAFGFENFHSNSFEQLVVNVASEQINYYLDQFIFRWEREENIIEEIPVSTVDNVTSCQKVMDLVLARPIGLLSLLDEESKFPSSSDRTLASKFSANLELSFGIFRAGKSEFTINHYADEVLYSVEGFLEKNRNFLPPQVR